MIKLNKTDELSQYLETFYDLERLLYERELEYLFKGIKTDNINWCPQVELYLRHLNLSYQNSHKIRLRNNGNILIFGEDEFEFSLFHGKEKIFYFKGTVSELMDQKIPEVGFLKKILFNKFSIEFKLLKKGLDREEMEKEQMIFQTDLYMNHLFNNCLSLLSSQKYNQYKFIREIIQKRNNSIFFESRSIESHVDIWGTNDVIQMRIILNNMWVKGIDSSVEEFIEICKSRCRPNIEVLKFALSRLDKD